MVADNALDILSLLVSMSKGTLHGNKHGKHKHEIATRAQVLVHNRHKDMTFNLYTHKTTGGGTKQEEV